MLFGAVVFMFHRAEADYGSASSVVHEPVINCCCIIRSELFGKV
jgi:hypothetical protein